MKYIGGFEIYLFPRYCEGMKSPALQANLVSQAALWDSLYVLAACGRGMSVELRTVSRAQDGSIHIYLLLLQEHADGGFVHEVKHLLPRDYAYSILTAEQISTIVHPLSNSGWRVARVCRRTQFIDLPSLLLAEDGNDSDKELSAPSSRVFTFGPDSADATRYLPQDLEDTVRNMDSTRYCLPLLGQMKEFPSDRRQFYEELQSVAPVITSATLHAFPERMLEEDRQVATRFRMLIDQLAPALDNSGFAHLESLRRNYDRYFLTRQYLSFLTVRVAAESDAQAIAVASQLTSWIGGIRGFTVHVPTRSFPDISAVMAGLELEVPADVSSSAWKSKLDKLSAALADERIESPDDPRYSGFLLRLPHVYTLEEVSQVMRLPVSHESGIAGLTTRMLPPFFPASLPYSPVVNKRNRYSTPAGGRIRIGRVNPSSTVPADGSEQGFHWHTIPQRDLCKHALIVGSTGSGKTITTLFLMRELVRLRIPFLVVEPVKTEYYDGLRSIPEFMAKGAALKRFNFEGNRNGLRGPDYLAFDPMRLQSGLTVSRHVSYLKTCFEAAFPMEAWQSLFLENAILDYYLGRPEDGGCGLKLFSRGSAETLRVKVGDGSIPAKVYPSFATFSEYFLGYFLTKEYARTEAGGKPNEMLETMRQIFSRRFQNLSRGPLGEAFRLADARTAKNQKVSYAPFSYLLDGPTVIELDAIPDAEQKSLIMAFLMTFLYERRQVDDLLERERVAHGGEATPLPDVKHVLVIEEAHRLLANADGGKRGESVGMGAQAKAVSLFVDMLAEIRAFRQSIVIVEQIPTKLVPAAVKNTNLKIMLRITSRDDRDYLGEAMSFNEEQKNFVSSFRAEPPATVTEGGKAKEKPGRVQFVAFDENVEQPVLLTLPLRYRPDGQRWVFDEYFDAVDVGKEGNQL